jgi:hypothetical protein
MAEEDREQQQEEEGLASLSINEGSPSGDGSVEGEQEGPESGGLRLTLEPLFFMILFSVHSPAASIDEENSLLSPKKPNTSDDSLLLECK